MSNVECGMWNVKWGDEPRAGSSFDIQHSTFLIQHFAFPESPPFRVPSARIPHPTSISRRRCCMTHNIFITGVTGYIGSRLAPELVARGHAVRALVRAGSEGKLPQGVTAVPGNALEGSSFAKRIAPSDTIHPTR